MAPTTRPKARTERRPTAPPPKPEDENKQSQPTEKKRTSADKKLAANIAGMYQGVGALVVGIGMRANDGGIAGAGVQTIELAEPISEAWLDLCDTNPKVRKALVRLTEVSTVGVLVSMHITIALPVLVSRGIVPEQFAAAAAAATASENNGGNANGSN